MRAIQIGTNDLGGSTDRAVKQIANIWINGQCEYSFLDNNVPSLLWLSYSYDTDPTRVGEVQILRDPVIGQVFNILQPIGDYEKKTSLATLFCIYVFT